MYLFAYLLFDIMPYLHELSNTTALKGSSKIPCNYYLVINFNSQALSEQLCQELCLPTALQPIYYYKHENNITL